MVSTDLSTLKKFFRPTRDYRLYPLSAIRGSDSLLRGLAMRIVGLDGRSYSWNVSAYEANQDRECSSYHEQARLLLQRVYPLDRILEEVHLPGSGGLTADFYLPHRRLLVEAHGQQHYEFIRHFHGDYLGFLAGQKRDSDKRRWCELNNIVYLELAYDRIPEWEDKLRASVG